MRKYQKLDTMRKSPYKIKRFFFDNPIILLRLSLGIVFILAGLHRILFFKLAYDNFLDIGLVPAVPLVVITIIVELIVGISFITNKLVKYSCILLAVLLVVGIIASILKAGYALIRNINEVFLLTYTPTDITLHLSYLIGALTLLLFTLRKRNQNI